jgi:hypothetical protein
MGWLSSADVAVYAVGRCVKPPISAGSGFKNSAAGGVVLGIVAFCKRRYSLHNKNIRPEPWSPFR